jgi:hypothetical protein
MSEQKYLPLDEDRHHGIGVKDNTKLKNGGGMKFVHRHAGAFLATPFMLFNAVTTVAGVTLILPLASGLPIGIFLSSAYILVTVSEKIKKQHSLRRLVLLYIFATCSTYTSFFSIYQEMSEVKLEHQAIEKTVETHNNFVNNLRVSLTKQINDLSTENPKIDKIKRLNQDLEKFTEQRAQFDKEGKDKAAGEMAGRVKYTKRELQSLLESMEDSAVYQFHQKLLDLQEQKKGTLKSSLSVQTFINSEQTSSELFAQDASLYRDIFSELENTNANSIDSDFAKNNKAPEYDDYIKTPIFLIPFETLVGGANRQLGFMLFAIVISILMEVIPLLLSGINAEGKDDEDEDNIEARLQNGRLLLPVREPHDLLVENLPAYELEYPPKTAKHPMDRTSQLVSSFVFDTKRLYLDIYKSMSRGVGTADNIKNIVDKKLHQSMASAHLNTWEEQYKFLVIFYESIHRDDLEISLSNFPGGDNLDDELFRYRMAAELFISVMRDRRIGWLKKSSKDEEFTKELNLGEHGTDRFTFPELFAQRKKRIKKWQFVNETAYQDFLDWWLLQQHNNKNPKKKAEDLEADLNLAISYNSNSHTRNNKEAEIDRD